MRLPFVIGGPYEIKKDVEDEVRLFRKYPFDDGRLFFNTVPYPGTGLFNGAKEKKNFLTKPEIYFNNVSCCMSTAVSETPELVADARVRLRRYLQRDRKDINHKDFLRTFERLGILSHASCHFSGFDFVR